MPESTSPVPAVASAAVPPRLMATRSPSVTIVSSPFSTTMPPLRFAASRACSEPPRLDRVRLLVEQPPELPLVRGQHDRPVALGQQSELAGVGVQPVGVEHERRLDPLRELAREVLRPVLAPHARAENDGSGRLGGLHDLLGGRSAQEALAAGASDRHHLGELGLDDRLDVGGDRGRRVAGAGADRAAGGHADGAGEPARAAGDQDLARAELGRGRRAKRCEPQDAVVDQADRASTGAPSGIPIGATWSSPVVRLAGRDPVADLGGVEA